MCVVCGVYVCICVVYVYKCVNEGKQTHKLLLVVASAKEYVTEGK